MVIADGPYRGSTLTPANVAQSISDVDELRHSNNFIAASLDGHVSMVPAGAKSTWNAAAGDMSLPVWSSTPITAKVGNWTNGLSLQTAGPWFIQPNLPTGSSLTMTGFSDPTAMKTALLAGQQDMVGTTIVQAIVSASQGEPVVLVASQCNKCSGLVVGNSSGINTIADLRGKKVLYMANTIHEYFLREELATAGMTINDIIHVNGNYNAAYLQNGTVDACQGGEAGPTDALAQGYGRVIAYPVNAPSTSSIGTINAGMLVTRQTVDTQPDKVAALVLGLAKGTQYLQNNQDVWINQCSAYTRPVLVASVWNTEICWDMDDQYIAHVKALAQKMKDNGMISTLPNWDTFIDTRFVAQARKSVHN
ncbi:MAG: ABC transporter substrate-binding protein [bacterium]